MDCREDEVVLVEKRGSASSLVAPGGSSVSSVRKRSRFGYPDAITESWTRSA
jgi:hypothetical protein